MAGRMMTRRQITGGLAAVFGQVVSRMASRFIKTEIRKQRLVLAELRMIVSVFCLSSVFCHAEEFPDPTRPPASILTPAAGTETGRGERAISPSGLHSVFISETRRAAIIDGQTVELGDEHGGAKLVEVNEGGVVLQRAHGRQVLTLFPGVKIIRKGAADKDTQVKRPSSASNLPSYENKTQATETRTTAHKEGK